MSFGKDEQVLRRGENLWQSFCAWCPPFISFPVMWLIFPHWWDCHRSELMTNEFLFWRLYLQGNGRTSEKATPLVCLPTYRRKKGESGEQKVMKIGSEGTSTAFQFPVQWTSMQKHHRYFGVSIFKFQQFVLWANCFIHLLLLFNR